MISVFGSTGFIGSKFCSIYNRDTVRIERDSTTPLTSNILYLTSTTTNYNIFTDPHVDINTNLNLLIDVLEECKKKDNIVFNFVSSWFVYGKIDHLPAAEDSPCNPKGFYSITKRAAEQLLISYCETYDINYRIFRLANVYGETDPKISQKRNALQYLINQLSLDKDVDLYDDGSHIRDYMYVDDVCKALKLCMEKAPLNEILNIGTGKPHSIREILEYSKKSLNSKGKLNSITPPTFHDIVQVKNMYLNVEKLSALGYTPEYNIWKGIEKILERIQK